MIDYSDHSAVLSELGKSQDADTDQREMVREEKSFVVDKNGQWEQQWYNQQDGQPRYQFDLTTNIVNQVAGKLAQADFAGSVEPIGGEASKDNAQTLDGIIRNIQVISNATKTYNTSARSMITGGLDGWRVVQRYIDGDSFDQDLMIENVENFVDRVWLDVASEKQDGSDARHGWIFTAFTPEQYKTKWPDGSAMTLSSDATVSRNQFFNKPDVIMVGEFYFIKYVKRELILMSNGAVYEDDDDYAKIKDELASLQVTEIKRRKRKKPVVYSRKMDQGGWLGEEEKTVFEWIPLIPTYGNYEIVDGAKVYSGVVRRVMDFQRNLNYAMSREIAEGALAPRAKYWMTSKQAKGHVDTLATLNTNNDPVQLYDPDAEAPGPPQQNGGASINPGLRVMSETMAGMLPQSAGLFAPSLGDNPNAQSGVAIDKLQSKGDVGTAPYFESQEVAICHTMRILLKAIPKVYLGERQVRVLRESMSFDMVSLNETVIDNETGGEVTLNNLAEGSYDVTCSSGPSFQNKQQETVSAMVEIGQVDPSIIGLGGDILIGNVTAPGMKDIAARKRQQLMEQGLIPADQMTDEEKEQAQAAAQQPSQPDAMMVAAQAEMQKAQADMQAQQNKQIELQIKAQDMASKNQISEMKLMLDNQGRELREFKAVVDIIDTQADTFKKLVDGSGADAVLSPSVIEAIDNQAKRVIDSQEGT